MSVLVRIDRVLRARDRLHEQFLIPQDADSLDEGLFYLDVALLQLVGAFDALARAANLVVIGPKGQRQAYWRGDWREKKLAPKAAPLAAMMKPETAARDTLDLAALLRNSVHGDVLRGVTARGAASWRRGRTRQSCPAPSRRHR